MSVANRRRQWHSAKKFSSCRIHFFGSTCIQLVGFGERDGQHSLVTFLVCCSSTHGAPVSSKSGGGHVPSPCPMESARLTVDYINV